MRLFADDSSVIYSYLRSYVINDTVNSDKIDHCLAPEYLTQLLPIPQQVYALRQQYWSPPIRYKYQHFECLFSHSLGDWNKLPSTLRCIDSLSLFKQKTDTKPKNNFHFLNFHFPAFQLVHCPPSFLWGRWITAYGGSASWTASASP